VTRADDGQFVAAACSGKARFATWSSASRSRKRMLHRRAAICARLSIYRCRFCQHWHIGG